MSASPSWAEYADPLRALDQARGAALDAAAQAARQASATQAELDLLTDRYEVLVARGDRLLDRLTTLRVLPYRGSRSGPAPAQDRSGSRDPEAVTASTITQDLARAEQNLTRAEERAALPRLLPSSGRRHHLRNALVYCLGAMPIALIGLALSILTELGADLGLLLLCWWLIIGPICSTMLGVMAIRQMASPALPTSDDIKQPLTIWMGPITAWSAFFVVHQAATVLLAALHIG